MMPLRLSWMMQASHETRSAIRNQACNHFLGTSVLGSCCVDGEGGFQVGEWVAGDLTFWAGCDLRKDFRSGAVILATVSRLKPRLQRKKRCDRPYSIRLQLPTPEGRIFWPRISDFATEELAKQAAEKAVAQWMKSARMRWEND